MLAAWSFESTYALIDAEVAKLVVLASLKLLVFFISVTVIEPVPLNEFNVLVPVKVWVPFNRAMLLLSILAILVAVDALPVTSPTKPPIAVTLPVPDTAPIYDVVPLIFVFPITVNPEVVMCPSLVSIIIEALFVATPISIVSLAISFTFWSPSIVILFSLPVIYWSSLPVTSSNRSFPVAGTCKLAKFPSPVTFSTPAI